MTNPGQPLRRRLHMRRKPRNRKMGRPKTRWSMVIPITLADMRTRRRLQWLAPRTLDIRNPRMVVHPM